jgi:ribose transport system permease protein
VFNNLGERFPALGTPRLVFAHSYKWPTFLNAENLLNVANQMAVVAILAAGMTIVIVTGGIDLSVGSLIALSAVVVAFLIRESGGVAAGAATLIVCSIASIAMCAVIGLLSGTIITTFRVPPFIATLGVMLVANGLAYKIAKGQSIADVPKAFAWLGQGKGLFSIPHAVVLMGLIYVVTHLLMSRTALGRHIYAVGGNADAARLSGVRIGRVRLFAYTFCGALAGLGGILLASQLTSGSPTYGTGYELDVIAAVVVGGASLSGGEGRIIGSLVGSLIIAVIKNGMNLTGVESYDQKVVLGLVILGAVLLDQARRGSWQWPSWFRRP